MILHEIGDLSVHWHELETKIGSEPLEDAEALLQEDREEPIREITEIVHRLDPILGKNSANSLQTLGGMMGDFWEQYWFFQLENCRDESIGLVRDAEEIPDSELLGRIGNLKPKRR